MPFSRETKRCGFVEIQGNTFAMKYSFVAIVAAASAEAAMGFAPVAPASRSGVFALRAQV